MIIVLVIGGISNLLAGNDRVNTQNSTSNNLTNQEIFNEAEQPIFYVSFKSNVCLMNVFLNGFPVQRAGDIYPVGSIILASTYMVNGKNTLQIQLHKPDKGSLSERLLKGIPCMGEATLSVATKSHREPINIATVKFTAPPDSLVYREGRDEGTTQAGYYRYQNDTFNLVESSKQGDVKVGKAKVEVGDVFYYYDREPVPHMLNVPGLTLTNDITLPMTFPEWIWEKGEPLKNDFATKEELYNEVYVPLFKALKDKDIDSSRELLAPGLNDLAKATYTQNVLNKTIEGLKRLVNDPDLTLFDLGPINDALYLNVYNGKVAAISFWQGSPIIGFNDRSTGDSSVLFYMYFVKVDGKWRAVF